MATTENLYTGDGSTVLYSFTFPYIETAHIKVSVNAVDTTAYTLANATTVQFNTAPASGAKIRIYRLTPADTAEATFYPGSAIRAQDLNSNFTQTLYVTQESVRDVTGAKTDAAAALTAANTATATANTALTTANTAITDSATALTQSNTAISNAATAVSTANTANTNATNAVNTADTALAAVSEALNYTTVANVAAIPGSPQNGDAVRVLDSTGIESFTPLTGVPGGFVGNSALTAEIYYDGVGTPTWVWSRYFPVDPESRYEPKDATILKDADIGVTVQAYDVTILKDADIGVTVQAYDATILKGSDLGVTVQGYDADTVKTDVLPTFTVSTRTTERTITGGAFDLATGNLWTVGAITVPNPTNAVSGQTGAIRITAGPVVWSSNFKFPGGSAPTITTFPAVIPYYVQDSTNILMGYVTEAIA